MLWQSSQKKSFFLPPALYLEGFRFFKFLILDVYFFRISIMISHLGLKFEIIYNFYFYI